MVNFNDILMLRSLNVSAVLSGDTGDFIGNDSASLYMVTCCPDTNPYSRSAFRIVRYREEKREYASPDLLHFGESFHIVTHPQFHRQPLYLYSTMKSIQNASKLSSEQLVALAEK